MRIVIDIDEETFNKLPNAELGSNVVIDVLDAVEEGTPLPKGHGRLVDADKYQAEINRIFPCNDSDDLNIRRATEIALNNADIIIEADGGAE